MISVGLTISVLLATVTAELSGRVVNDAGQPIENAIVVISTAKPRVGPATTCPSCYVDCAKRTICDGEGRFVIEGLSPRLLFSLAAGAPEHQGFVSSYFDPSLDPEIELKLESLPDTPGVNSATGTVVDSRGTPIAGAVVNSRTIYRKNGVNGVEDRSVTPLTLTDDDGNFWISAGEHIDALDLRVVAAGLAPNEAKWYRADLGDLPANTPHRLTVIVETEDGSRLPQNSAVYLNRRDAWRGTTRELARAPKDTVILNEMNMDLKRNYLIRVNEDFETVFVIRKVGAPPGAPQLAPPLEKNAT